MIKPLIIIKLGGSVITHKNSQSPKARLKVINNLTKDIATIYKDFQIIVIHGAGSYGHPLAKKYALNKGMKTTDQRYYLSVINKLMTKLSLTVVDSLQKNQIPAISLPPHAFIETSGGEFAGFQTSIIEKMLQHDLVPVLYGDALIDDVQGCSILSGDVQLSYLAHQLNASRVILLSDVDGIFDSDPKVNPESKLISEVRNNNLEKVLKGITSTSRADVTGGMQGKILSIKEHLINIPVYIINGLTPQSLTSLLRGEKLGTKLYFS